MPPDWFDVTITSVEKFHSLTLFHYLNTVQKSVFSAVAITEAALREDLPEETCEEVRKRHRDVDLI